MSPSEPETEVIKCPACRHFRRVPLNWLGQPVQCPECRAKFRALIRDDKGLLTVPELISRPTPTAQQLSKKLDAMLLLPAFGLMVCGIVGTIVNGVSAYRMIANPEAAKQAERDRLQDLRKMGFGANDPPQEQAQRDDERAGQVVGVLRWVLPPFGVVSVVVFLGGLAIALRRYRRLAQVACVLATLNVPQLCCVPGAVAGIWGLVMLSSSEGRAHFQR